MKLSLIIVSLFICLSACNSTSKRSKTNILLHTEAGGAKFEKSLSQTVEKAGWHYTKAPDLNYFQEDSLQQYSSIFVDFSTLNKLDYKAINALKRYLEAEGGGIVAIKDTLLTQKEWPWLQAWNELPTGVDQKQDAGNLKILNQDFTGDDLQKSLAYAIGNNRLPDYSKATTLAVPEASRYTYQVLAQGLDEPMQLAILPNNDVLFVERKGAVKLYSATKNQTETIANFDVFSGIEDGLLGAALDPDFKNNNWVYFYYAVAGDKAINRLSRMELKEGNLLRATEKTLLEIPTQRQYCCHSAGYIQFGPDGLLYLSTGDNTNAEETEGYIPIDERPGRALADDQATAANSNDLRGKILRIKPEPNGTYSIPEGNLFPKGTPKTRPEIYTMGHRNPYRFTVDMKNNYVYWGDIGPDTKVPSSEGTLSFDEVNQARKPGFFGWPYFLGNNEAFPYYDFATKKEGPKFNPSVPINNSPNNTGIKNLPPAQPAMIWYGDGNSKKFPLVGKGGESAMAGPVYYSDLFADAPFKLPPYYDEKLIIYDWVRRWFMAVTFDKDKNFLRMEPFLDHLPFNAPTDIKFATDGAIYILEYGTNWFAKNTDAQLIRIEYSEGNRKPLAKINTSNLYGAAPFKLQLSAADSKDFDKEDSLEYKWLIEGKELKGENISHTFNKPGVYKVALTVTDNHEETGTSNVEIKVGNAPPVVDIITAANQSFYWNNTVLDYKVQVSDKEDQRIDTSKVNISLNFLPRGKDIAVALTNPQTSNNLQFVKGQYLLNNLDCKACHSVNQVSVGPAYSAIAARYTGKAEMVDKLAQKVIKGGSGNWGKRMMSSHPDLAAEDAKEIVNYILSLNQGNQSLPMQGAVTLKDHLGKGNEGSYLLMANYTDKGANKIEPLSARSYITLRNPLVQIEDYDGGNITLRTVTTEFLTYSSVRHGNFVKFNQIDFTNLKNIKYRLFKRGVGGKIEVRLGKIDGPLVSTISIPAGQAADEKTGWTEMVASLKETKGKHDLFLIFAKEKDTSSNLFDIDWLYFSN
ncbi:PQQ-dependent sugar dehydrogenase [Adhaeribacter swui]|uniref:PQQ-dependent sugar dehydrogenase n=1 Tax=Adhaeribacter swui TaxID=2086471 RepID=A0A7G7GES6_9BACT|nr:PQQ-dependent sugar dehydrogenase [Adhaeribacter swui]QNF35660.1 PQQ-dependent sugar dehydrogenase [Adhaeribacter swui]